MSSSPLGGMRPTDFLADYWQREPCLIRGAFPDFDPLLDGDDLAGLACESLAEARLVRGPDADGQWRVQYGPFEEADFAALGDHDWTLLVQDVEKHYPPLRPLLAAFDFLPTWRLDDLMASFAAPGGSVGPHVDQYDVFLLQARGRRRWDIAREFDPEPLPDVPLAMLRSFEAEDSWVLEAGDLLYLPPGIAHHGVAIDACMTYSIGLRAPSAADLHLALGEWLASEPGEGGRYTDPRPLTPGRPGEIDAAALSALRELLLRGAEDDESLGDFLASFLSRFRLAHEPAPPEQAPSEKALGSALQQGAVWWRNPWTRFVWRRHGKEALLFATGTPHRCSIELAERLCGAEPLEFGGADGGARELSRTDRATLFALVSAGHLLPGDA